MLSIIRLSFLVAMTLIMSVAYARAEPVQLSDFMWKNRLLVGCDMVNSERHVRHHDLTLRVFKIALADAERSRKLAIVTVGTSSWSVAVDAPDYLSDGYSALSFICPDCAYEFTELERRQIADRLRCSEGDQVMALIGLDGNIKRVWRDEMPDAETVFALIDAMPMRQRELQSAPN